MEAQVGAGVRGREGARRLFAAAGNFIEATGYSENSGREIERWGRRGGGGGKGEWLPGQEEFGFLGQGKGGWTRDGKRIHSSMEEGARRRGWGLPGAICAEVGG